MKAQAVSTKAEKLSSRVTTLEKASKLGMMLSEDGEWHSSIDYGKTAAHAVEKVEALGERVDFHGQRAESLTNKLETVQRRFNNTLHPQRTNLNNPLHLCL